MLVTAPQGCRVFPVGMQTTVTLTSPALRPDATYGLRVFSLVNRSEDRDLERRSDGDGRLACPLALTTAGEYQIWITDPQTEEQLVREAFFALADELLALRPYKGDLHIHTTDSDGRDTGPAMACAARALGMDFIAITDHDCHDPAVETRAACREEGLDLTVILGEEVTIRDVGGHILALGSSASTGKLRHAEASDAERIAIRDRELADAALLPPLTPEGYAHALWTLRCIRRLGGRVFLAHPYWLGGRGTYYPPRALVRQLLDDRLCDGVELIGGSPDAAGNMLCLATWCEEAARGNRLAVIGGSDAHETAELGRIWTIAFSAANDEAALLEALDARRCVACERRGDNEVAIYGPAELVEYAYFLQREFLPVHDCLCAAQIEGTDKAAARAALADLFENFWFRRRP